MKDSQKVTLSKKQVKEALKKACLKEKYDLKEGDGKPLYTTKYYFIEEEWDILFKELGFDIK